jgi:hypothetical protein
MRFADLRSIGFAISLPQHSFSLGAIFDCADHLGISAMDITHLAL